MDWCWKFRVGDFDIAAHESERILDLTDPYWHEAIENEPAIMEALEGTIIGEGESYRYIRRHIDDNFVDAAAAAIKDNETAICARPHTPDFIAFVAISESDFIPELVVIGDRRQFDVAPAFPPEV